MDSSSEKRKEMENKEGEGKNIEKIEGEGLDITKKKEEGMDIEKQKKMNIEKKKGKMDNEKKEECEAAARDGRWDVVIALLCGRVCPADTVLNQLFDNMTPQLFSSFAFNNLHSTVLSRLLKYAWHCIPESDILQMIQTEKVLREPLMNIMVSAVVHRKTDFLQNLFTHYPMSIRVFRQYISDVEYQLQDHKEILAQVFFSLYSQDSWHVSLRMEQTLFRRIIVHFTQEKQRAGLDPFVFLCSDYFHGRCLSPQFQDDWKFVCTQAIQADRYQCIFDTMERCKSECGAMLRIFLHIFVVNADLHQKLARSLDGWIGSCSSADRLPDLFASDGAEEDDRASMACCVQWCLDRSFYNLAFVLAFCLEDWQKVSELLSTPQYRPVFRVTACAQKLSALGQFSAAVTLLEPYNNIRSVSGLSFQECRLTFALADSCLKAGLTICAMHLAFPDCNRTLCLLQTHPEHVNDVLMSSATHEVWELFERVTKICTDPDEMVRLLMREAPDAWKIWRWKSLEKLVDRCTNSELRFELLDFAVSLCKLDMVKSMMEKVNMTLYVKRSPFLLSHVLDKLCENPRSFQQVQLLRLFIKAGISTVVRSAPLTDRQHPNPGQPGPPSQGRFAHPVPPPPGMFDLPVQPAQRRHRFQYNSDLDQAQGLLPHLYRKFPPDQGKLMVEVTRLVIDSGAFSYRTLDALRRDPSLKQKLKETRTLLKSAKNKSSTRSAVNMFNDPDILNMTAIEVGALYQMMTPKYLSDTDKAFLEQSLSAVVKAAATPLSLQHLARLTVSEAIGCHPGRAARIEKLKAPSKIKDLISFKDFTDDGEKKAEQSSAWPCHPFAHSRVLRLTGSQQ